MLGLGGAAAAAARLSGRSLAAVQRQVRRGLHGSDGAASGAPPEPVRVLCNGVWDVFHAGHASILEQAKALGDYLLVGIYNDGIVNSYRGKAHPVLNLNERVLSVLACKYVDDIVIDPPYVITQEMVAALNISVVVTGHQSESRGPMEIEDSVYRVPEEMGILRRLNSKFDFTMDGLLERIQANYTRLEAKVKKKMAAEAEHYQQKHGLDSYDVGDVAMQ